MKTGLCSTLVVLALVGAGSPVLACDNFVGGVCLDAKKAPTQTVKPKRVIQKKTVKPKAARNAPAQAPAAKASASKCVKLSAGSPYGYDVVSAVTYSNLTASNACTSPITVYLRLNSCSSSKAYFGALVGKSTRSFQLGAGKSVGFKISHAEGLRGAAQLARATAVYANQGGGGYPDFGC